MIPHVPVSFVLGRYPSASYLRYHPSHTPPMAYHVHIEPQHRLGIVFLSGTVTGTTLTQAGFDLLHHPSWQRGFDEVWDFTRALKFAVTPGEFDQSAAHEREHADLLGQGRVVSISNRFFVRALHRLFGAMTPNSGRTHHSVRSRDEAAALLGVPSAALTPPSQVLS